MSSDHSSGSKGKVSSRIYRGVKVRQGDRQYQLLVTATDATANYIVMECGGTLINIKWLLTAAHCVTKESVVPIQVHSTFLIIGGRVDRKQSTQGRVVRQHQLNEHGQLKEHVFVHHQWKGKEWEGFGNF